MISIIAMKCLYCGEWIIRHKKALSGGLFYLVEAYGTGLAAIRSVYEDKNGQPEFIAGPASFRVVLPNMNTLGDLQNVMAEDATEYKAFSDETEKALRFIEERGEVTRNEVAAQMGFSASSAIRLMKKLRDSGLVVSIGNGKNVKYRIAE